MGNAQRKAAYPKNTNTSASGTRKVHWDGLGLPAPPGKPILIPGTEDSQPDVVGIRWERSSSNGGSAIIGYLVEHRRVGSSNWIRSAPVLCTYPEMTLSGLEPGWRYQFRIKARNALGLSEPSELSEPLSVSLQRSIADAPKFEQELKDTVVIEGEQVEFVVQFSGAPLPKISWFKDGFEIFNGRRTRVETANGKSVLQILRTILDDEGEIKCSATNKAGHISTRATLRLEAPPRIRLPQQYEEGVLFEQGETIRSKAIITGRPLPSITWYHDGEIISADDRHVFESITECESILKIPDAKRQDRGEYSIRAINKLGEDSASFLVTVTDRPSAPGKVQILTKLGTSVTLTWKVPEDDGGCKIGTYIVEYYRLGWDVWLKAATCRQTTVTLNDLIEDSEYRFRVKAENPYGVSDPCEKSDIVFIPDPKRGITEPNMREKSQSHRDIPRGRSERREVTFVEPTKRTRSLTREESSMRGMSGEYTVSTQRLILGCRPSRADSRVTFALDTTTSDKSESTKKQWSKEQLPDPTEVSKNQSTKTTDTPTKNQLPTIITITPSFDDSGGGFVRDRSISRERSPSPMTVKDNVDHAASHDRTHLSPVRTVKKSLNEIRDDQPVSLRSFEGDNDENVLHGSSEFMIVLYPEDRTEHVQSIEKKSSMIGSKMTQQMSSESAGEETEDDLVPPPRSHSLPELFSLDHQITEVFREAVSSTELLHEHAMERFYRAVAAENATDQPKRPLSLDAETSKRLSDTEPYALFDSKNRIVRRRLSGNQVISWQMRQDRRRSSEGQGDFHGTSFKLPKMLKKDATSDPNLRIDTKAATPSSGGDEAEHLRRWPEPGIDLTKEVAIAETASAPKMAEFKKEDEIYDEVEFEEGSIASFGSEAGSTDSEDLKQLRARILGIPTMDEEDTYHPSGIPVQHVEQPPPVPPHRIPMLDISPPIPDRSNYPSPPQSPTSLSPTPDKVPKSILKKRTDNDPVPVNQFGRPIPPEKPIRKSLPFAFNDNSSVTLRKRSLTNLNLTDNPQMSTSDADFENEAVISAAEAARTKRRQVKQNSKSHDAENEVGLDEERQAVVNHYMEIVHDYSGRNPNKYRSLSRERDTLSPDQTVSKESSPVPMSAFRPMSPSVERPIAQPSSESVTTFHRSRREETNNERRNSAGGKVRSGPPSRNESPASRSRNVSKERRPRNVSKDRGSGMRPRNTVDEPAPVIRSRNVSKERVSDSRSSSVSRAECFTPISKATKKSSRPSSRSSSRDRSRGSTPTEARLERLQKALNDRKHRPRKISTRDEVNGILMTIEAERNVRSTLSYVTDVGLLLVAMYVYFFKREIFAIPIIALLLYRYIQQEISQWFLRRE